MVFCAFSLLRIYFEKLFISLTCIMSTVFPDLGRHCSVKDCHLLDFLPFRCDSCKLCFCLDHRSYENHNCKIGKKKDNQAFFCPECQGSLNVGYGGNVDEAFAKHLSEECPSMGFPPKQAPPSSSSFHPSSSSPKCVVPGCKPRSSLNVFTTCKLCRQSVCLTHRFEKDHSCPRLPTSSSSPAYSSSPSPSPSPISSIPGPSTHPSCPECSGPLQLGKTGDFDEAFARHLADGCPSANVASSSSCRQSDRLAYPSADPTVNKRGLC